MKLTLFTYNGSTIATYSGTANIKGDTIGLDANMISVARAGEVVAYGGKSFKAEEFDIIFGVAASPESTRQTALEGLGQLFNPRDADLHKLVAKDTNDSDRWYYIDCTPSQGLKVDGLNAIVRMWTPDPQWKRYSSSSGTITIAGSATSSGTITNNGNVDCYPSITFTPTANAGYRAYRYHSIIYNPTSYGLANYPINVAGTSLSGTVEIAAGRMQADGDDIMVKVNGVTVERWVGNINTTSTKVWVALDFAPKIEAVIGGTALAASGNTYIEFADSVTGRDAIQRIPSRGMVLIDSEVIAYTGKNVQTRRLTIDDEGRGAKDTTAATHALAATIRWIQHDIVILHGNASVSAPVQTDKRKPCFSLDNSSNTNWRWDSADSVFCDLAGLRSGGWKPSKAAGIYSDWYTGNQGTAGTDPATDMGAEVNSYGSGGVTKAETARIHWTLHNNCGMGTVSAVGESYRSLTGTPWPTCRLQSSPNGTNWVTEYDIATPGTAAVWTTWTQASEALPTNTRFIRFEFWGAVNAVNNSVARNEVNLGAAGSMGATFTTANVPQLTLTSRTNNAEVNFTITNTTTSEALSYSYPLKANQTLRIDTEARTIELKRKLLAPPDLDGVRQEWLRLQPGANVISYADSTGSAGTLIFTYKERKNV